MKLPKSSKPLEKKAKIIYNGKDKKQGEKV